MPNNKDYEDLLQHFNDAGVKYLVVGAYAVIYYTEPRYTKDIDIWVEPSRENAEKVYAALRAFGAPVADLTIEDLTNLDMVYQMGIEPNRIDVLMGVTGLQFDKAWETRVALQYGDTATHILDLDSLIEAKKAAGRKQDEIDLEVLELAKKSKKK